MDKDSYYYYGLGEESLQNNEINMAIKYYLKSVRLNKHFKTFERLYECYCKLEQLDLAYFFLQLAYEENTNNDKVAFLYSLCMIEENRKNEAKDILLSIIERNPNYKKAKIEYEKIEEHYEPKI